MPKVFMPKVSSAPPFQRHNHSQYELQFPVVFPVADGLCDMFGRDFFDAGQAALQWRLITAGP
jgi:hypothetical protein